MEDNKIPLKFKSGLLHVSIRDPPDENLLNFPFVDITSDEPWDPRTLDYDEEEDLSPQHFRGDSMHSTKVTKLGKILGTEEQMDLKSLVNAVQSTCQLETHYPELTDSEIELHPFLGWKTMEVIKEMLENTTHLTNLENRLLMK